MLTTQTRQISQLDPFPGCKLKPKPEPPQAPSPLPQRPGSCCPLLHTLIQLQDTPTQIPRTHTCIIKKKPKKKKNHEEYNIGTELVF